MADAAEVGRAYSEFFRDVRPLCTMVGVSELNRPAQLCEIEITAALEG
jgi:enamine deaminase RidA (YjgF/YER057c/UK114 family)